MNPEIKARWTAWLRANPDKQGHGRLADEGKFCCLGVLCELAVADQVIGEPWYDGRITHYGELLHSDDSTLSSYSVLPRAVRDWAGLAASDPRVHAYTGKHPLSYLNDNGFTFLEIADLIDAQL